MDTTRGEHVVMQKYLNESERVLKMISKKLVKLLDDLKFTLKYPVKGDLKSAMWKYRRLKNPNKKNPEVNEGENRNIKVFMIRDLVKLVSKWVLGERMYRE